MRFVSQYPMMTAYTVDEWRRYNRQDDVCLGLLVDTFRQSLPAVAHWWCGINLLSLFSRTFGCLCICT